MQIFFLSHKYKALTKTFTKKDDAITVLPYPHVTNLISHEENVETIDDLYNHIIHYSQQGATLCKGILHKKLNHESRANTTSIHDTTNLLVLDVDRCNPHITSPEQYINECLPNELKNTSYVFQYSASYGITKHSFVGHFFFLLDTPISATALKQQLIQWNFIYANDLIKLAANGITLTYPIDVTCAQNDKIIYIATPILNFNDPVQNRIQLVQKTNERVNLSATEHTHRLDKLIKEKINALQIANNITPHTGKYKTTSGTSYLTNPHPTSIFAGEIRESRGFRYGNINGGDSFAYYHSLRPFSEFLFNFKGEPTVKLEDIDPNYWAMWVEESNKTTQKPQGDEETEYMIIRAENDDEYKTVIHHKKERKVELHTIRTLKKIADWCKQVGIVQPQNIPTYTIIYKPDSQIIINEQDKTINTFSISKYMNNTTPIYKPTPKTMELLYHVMDGDKESTLHFINWLASAAQDRQKLTTAWVFCGEYGSGKGSIFNHLIAPIFGTQNCKSIMTENVDDKFNSILDKNLMLFIDESQVNERVRDVEKRMNKLKHIITEPRITIRRMRQEAKEEISYCNFIFASNSYDAIKVNAQERRFNFAPRQNKPLDWTQKDFDLLKDELQDFTNYLMHYPVNKELTRKVIHNQARADMIAATTTNREEFINALRAGDFDYFHQYQTTSSPSMLFRNYSDAIEVIKINLDMPGYVSINIILLMYRFIIREDTNHSVMGRILAANGLKTVRTICEDKQTTALPITWRSKYVLAQTLPTELPSPTELRPTLN